MELVILLVGLGFVGLLIQISCETRKEKLDGTYEKSDLEELIVVRIGPVSKDIIPSVAEQTYKENSRLVIDRDKVYWKIDDDKE